MRRARWLIVVAVLMLVAAACGGEAETGGEDVTEPAEDDAAEEEAPEEEAEPAEGGTIVIGTTDSISNIDSADSYAIHDWEILRNTGEGLTKFTPGTFEIEPGIAESWDVSDDGTVYTFHLRDGVTFGDGTELTADMYVQHLDRMLRLDGSGAVGGALGRPFIACIAEGEPEVDDEGEEQPTCDQYGIDAPDDSTVEITLTQPFGYFPVVVSGAAYVPSSPDFPADELVEFPEAPFYGVGPWTLESYTEGEQSVFVPNEHYHGEQPKADQIIVQYFEEASQLVTALQAGDIDVAWRSVTEPSLIEALDGAEGITSATVPGGNIRFFIMNHNIAPIDDQLVRQAIAAAIDRDEIVDRALGGHGEPLYSQIPTGFAGATEVFDARYESPNPDLAVDLLTQAGYSEDEPLELEINFPPNRYGGVVQDAMQIISEQLEDTGLVRVETVATEWATYLGELIQGQSYAMGFLGWFFDYPDTSNYIEPFVYNGGLGTEVTDRTTNEPASGLTEPELVDALLEAARESDEAAREGLYEQVQELYAEDVVTIPLWLEPERVFYRDYITPDTSASNAESLNISEATDFNWELLQTSQ